MTFPGHQHHSIRIPGYDYTRPGAYFITCVTHQRLHLFGEIVNGNLELSNLGKLAKKEWDHLTKRFPWIELDESVVMPNHIHGIIVIHDVGARGSSKRGMNLGAPRAPTQERFSAPVAGSIPTIIRSFKSSVTQLWQFHSNQNSTRVWQRNYYERVIRNEDEWEKIRKYIRTNPQNWADDEGFV